MRRTNEVCQSMSKYITACPSMSKYITVCHSMSVCLCIYMCWLFRKGPHWVDRPFEHDNLLSEMKGNKRGENVRDFPDWTWPTALTFRSWNSVCLKNPHRSRREGRSNRLSERRGHALFPHACFYDCSWCKKIPEYHYIWDDIYIYIINIYTVYIYINIFWLCGRWECKVPSHLLADGWNRLNSRKWRRTRSAALEFCTWVLAHFLQCWMHLQSKELLGGLRGTLW